MRPRTVVVTTIFVAFVAVNAFAVSRLITGGGFSFWPWADGRHEVSLGGAVPDLYAVPPLSHGVRPLDGARWLSVPVRDPSGAVFGLIDGPEGKAGVKLDEATGRVLWQVAAPDFLTGYHRETAWARDERVPRLPVAEQSGSSYLVAWARQWALFDVDTGALRSQGELPAGVPEVSEAGGVCPLASKLWIAVKDGGRGGGVLLDVDGRLEPARVLRPPGCGVVVGQRSDQHREQQLFSCSPQQNARQARSPWPDSCRYYSSSGSRGYHEVRYCSDMMTDGDASRDVLLHVSNLAFHEATGWRVVRFPQGPLAAEPVDFHGTPLSVELGVSSVFVDLGAYRFDDSLLRSPAESFEPDRHVKTTRRREVMAAIDRAGELRWARTVGAHDVEGGEGGLEPLLPHRSALFASHSRSPVHNLYVVKPGLLIALDQATGATRFEVGERP